MIWLSISLFTNRKNWNNLISLGIRPFLESNRLVKSYRITFNYLGGANLRLALLTEEGKADELAQSAHIHFDSYFESFRLQPAAHVLPIDEIFMPFPSNSIHFGLYPPIFTAVNDSERYTSTIMLSEIILYAFKDEIDEAMIVTFAFYIQSCLVKAIFEIHNFYDLPFVTLMDEEDLMASNVISGDSAMHEIVQEVMENDVFKGDLDWLNDWMLYSYDSFKSLEFSTNGKSKVVRDHYQALIVEINNQLGLTAFGGLSLSKWINNSFRTIRIKHKKVKASQ